jgi:hypothetical protein
MSAFAPMSGNPQDALACPKVPIGNMIRLFEKEEAANRSLLLCDRQSLGGVAISTRTLPGAAQ